MQPPNDIITAMVIARFKHICEPLIGSPKNMSKPTNPDKDSDIIKTPLIDHPIRADKEAPPIPSKTKEQIKEERCDYYRQCEVFKRAINADVELERLINKKPKAKKRTVVKKQKLFNSSKL